MPSAKFRKLLCYAGDATAARTWVAGPRGRPAQKSPLPPLGHQDPREYARSKIDGLRLVSGNPDFTNAPAHGDDDARFYDWQQAYVNARRV